MRIGVDYQTVAGRGGNARYTRELASRLSAQEESEIYLYNFLHDIRRRGRMPSGTHVHKRFVYLTPPYAPHNIQGFNEIVTKMAGWLEGLDVFHFTNPQNITRGTFKSVVTVHDMSTYTDKRFAKTASHTVLKKKLPLILQESDAIIAVSKYTKHDLVEHFGVAKEKVTVIYEAAGEEFYPDPDVDIFRRFNVSRFVMYAGQLQPRKNILVLFEAFASVHKQYSDVSLVLVGTVRDETYKKEMQKAIEHFNLTDAIVFTGRVNDATLRKLYSTTECFVYPSLFEGFGLPPLEAMQCGAPVVTSNTSSLPEVVGDAGILIDPTKSRAITEALTCVIGDKELQIRMRKASVARAKQFSWEKATKETLAVYKNVRMSI